MRADLIESETMLRRSTRKAAIACAIAFSLGASDAQEPVAAPPPQSPPPPPPVVSRNIVRAADITILSGQSLYSIGSPTDEEQYYVELINRARSNPAAEGLRLANTSDPDVLSAISSFGVDLGMMQTEFNAIAVAPPVSINAALTNGARGHSDWMFANATQSHTGSGGSSPGTRMTNAGYTWTTYGESIFSFAKSVFYGHAGFQIDWGGRRQPAACSPRAGIGKTRTTAHSGKSAWESNSAPIRSMPSPLDPNS